MSAFGSGRSEDDERFDAGADDDVADLPERIIVVREPPAGIDDDGLPPTGAMPRIDVDAPEDPDVFQAEPDALARTAAAAAAPADVDASDAAPSIDLDEVDLRAGGATGEVDEDEPTMAHAMDLELDLDDPDDLEDDAEADADGPGSYAATEGRHRAELDAMVAQVAASQVTDDEDDRGWRTPAAAPTPGRDETGPGTLRPKVPEPVVAVRPRATPSRGGRTVSSMRALMGLAVVVVLAGVGLAGAIGAAVLLIVLVLSRAFGSG